MQIGLEILRESPSLARDWGRCGLMANQASVTREFQFSVDILQSILGTKLVALFGPQHGFVSTVQDNMIETQHGHHGPSGLPVYSLYSDTREPTANMLSGLDTMVIDIQITGCRVYTFKYTISAILRAAKKHGKRVVVLDRPNPLGGILLEGRTLNMDVTSFVGEFPIPMRHGMTPGECAQFFNRSIGASLEVIAMKAWDPAQLWNSLSRHWVLTSPNLPTEDSVYVYPGMVAFEGTNVSEGRGTGLPFQFIGAPFIKNPEALVQRVKEYYDFTGSVFLRPTAFQPTSQKWVGEVCQGVHIHVLDPWRVNSFALAVALLRSIQDLCPSEFKWREPGYEYDFKNRPIDLIIGSKETTVEIASKNFNLSQDFWTSGISAYIEAVRSALLYPRQMEVHSIVRSPT